MFETHEKIYIINKLDNTSYNFDRDLFISKCKIKGKKDFDLYLKFANIYCNIKYYNLKYNLNIMTDLNKIIKNNNIPNF